ncbi:mitochondrial 54S ribosomal protein uL24m [Aspergillus lucknowensis]|uniref:KOW domain-containing protein n=1 Tax=Aspergillus lucknowensis TaxID=176173 RepID=A0ABR4LJ90_9EURO
MQKLIRRTALARNQSQRKAIRAAKQAQRDELKDSLRQRFAYNRVELDNIRAERLQRREDWMRGQLAPQRDAGLDAKRFGALNPHAMRPPPVPKHLRRKFVNLAPGDRVCLLKGRDKGKINEIIRVDTETETVTVKDLNVSDVHFPEWLSEQYGNKSPFQTIPLPIPMDDVRLVVALDDPATGQTRDVLVEHIVGGGPFLEREHGVEIPRHTRYIAGENIEIPWPRQDPPTLKDEVWDTLRMEVETPTWVPSLHKPPFPPSVLDELRNKFSKYRTRHDPKFVEQKRLEDLKREYIQSRSLVSVSGEHRSGRLSRDQSRRAKWWWNTHGADIWDKAISGKAAKEGTPTEKLISQEILEKGYVPQTILSEVVEGKTVEFIEEFMSKNSTPSKSTSQSV